MFDHVDRIHLNIGPDSLKTQNWCGICSTTLRSSSVKCHQCKILLCIAHHLLCECLNWYCPACLDDHYCFPVPDHYDQIAVHRIKKWCDICKRQIWGSCITCGLDVCILHEKTCKCTYIFCRNCYEDHWRNCPDALRWINKAEDP